MEGVCRVCVGCVEGYVQSVYTECVERTEECIEGMCGVCVERGVGSGARNLGCVQRVCGGE